MAPSFNKITQIKKGMTQIFQRRNYTRGVTLTELLIVVLIMAILGGMALPMLNKAIEKDRVKEAITNLNFIRMAEKSYFLANNTYTDIIANLNIEDPNSATNRYFDYTITAADATDFTAKAVRKSGAYIYEYYINSAGTITSNGSPLL